MKFFRFAFRIISVITVIVVIACICLILTDNGHLIKAVRSTYLQGKSGPTINDFTKFDNRTVITANKKALKRSKAYNQSSISPKLLEEAKRWETVALVILHKGELLHEQYWDGYSQTSKTNSFSMAKSLTSLCIGAAIKEGKIKSVDQKVSDFLPEFKEGKKAAITIKHLLTMSSGIDFGESYGDPFGFMAKTYYGTELYDITLAKKVKYSAGNVWKYQGGNTLLLSFIIEQATGQTLSDYFSSKFWSPINANQDALWTLDEKEGKEKAYCCFYSNALDYSRIGQLMLDSGNWEGKQLIDKSYFNASINPINLVDEHGSTVNHYGYQWWLGSYKDVSFYYARGILGQYIVSIPEWDMVIVRLGHKRDPKRGAIIPKDLFTYLEIGKNILAN